MSKNGELRLMRYGLSVDAPMNFNHRTGESSTAGLMIDRYAQVESVEDTYFGEQDEYAKQRYLKGFRVYMRKVFTEEENEFLQRVLFGQESAYEVGRAFGVKHFDFMRSIQTKAYKNIKPLAKLARLTGWSKAEEFTKLLYKRLEQLNAGYTVNEIIPENQKILKFRARKNAIMRAWRERNFQHWKAYAYAYMAKWRAEHREELRARSRQYYADNREREAERKKKQRQNPAYLARERARALAYYTEHAEERREHNREYFARNREEINAKHRAYYEANKERINAERNTPEKREKRLAYLREYGKAHREQEREYRRKRYAEVKERKQEMARRWRENNPEKAKEIARRAQERYRAKKKEKQALQGQ